MKPSSARFLVAGIVLLIFAIGIITSVSLGTISGFGWDQISLLCPVGALTTMLASKTIIPRAVVSIILVIIACFFLARAFCGWVCPVPLISKAKDLFKPKQKTKGASEPKGDPAESESAVKELTAEEKASLKKSCSSCAAVRGTIDSRHITLGASLLTAAIFGFPVFCLICPIGLTFATIFLVALLFGAGDLTWTVILAPVILFVELFVIRKWCSTFCPISAFLSLASKGNKTFKPTIDDSKCLETARGVKCGRCAEACEQGIDPRHPEQGASWSECTKCHACVEACPTHAITMPFLPKKKQAPVEEQVVVEQEQVYEEEEKTA